MRLINEIATEGNVAFMDNEWGKLQTKINCSLKLKMPSMTDIELVIINWKKVVFKFKYPDIKTYELVDYEAVLLPSLLGRGLVVRVIGPAKHGTKAMLEKAIMEWAMQPA